MKNLFRILLAGMLCALPAYGADDAVSRDEVLRAMKKATAYMMDTVSLDGGFVWTYLPDFSRRWGEMEAGPTMVWTQSQSTPEMGHLMLDAYHATGDEYYYDAALKVAGALIRGQLPCGGWNYCFDVAGEASLKNWYATIGANGWRLEEFQHYYGNATFDDACTTNCGEFLLRMYLERNDPACKEALEKVIAFVLESQYSCGGWPQRYPLMSDHPVGGQADYTPFITLNDDVLPACIEFLLKCSRCLDRPALLEPVRRAMYLCIRLQQPAPYAGWADQYTVEDLRPVHARTYEPAAVNTSTTMRMISNMYHFYGMTGDTLFLSGIPAAIDFLAAQELSAEDAARAGRRTGGGSILVPRFVDPETGTPHYIHREGSNVQNGRYYYDTDPAGTIGHYSSFATVNVASLRQRYETVRNTPKEEITKDSPLLHPAPAGLNRYYTRGASGFGRSPETVVAGHVASQTTSGIWLTPLYNTSHPYAPYSDTVPSHDRQYVSTNVGDEHDTSPFATREPPMGISTSDFISRMSAMLHYIAGE